MLRSLLLCLLILNPPLSYSQELEDVDLDFLEETSSTDDVDSEDELTEDLADDLDDTEALEDVAEIEESQDDDGNDFDDDLQSIDDVLLSDNELENVAPEIEVELDDTAILDSTDTNEEINSKFINNFAKLPEVEVDNIITTIQKDKTRNFTKTQIAAMRIQLKDINDSPIRLIHIIKGTKLIRISDNKAVYTPKNLTVRAHTLLNFYKNRYVVSKSGELLYKIYSQDSSYINQVTNLYRSPHYFTSLPKKKYISEYDNDFQYTFQYSLQTGLNSPSYTESLLGNVSSFAPMIRTEATFLTNKKGFFETGFTLMYEEISGTFSTSGSYKINSLSIGPTLKLRPRLLGFGVILQPRIDLFSQINLTQSSTRETASLNEMTMLVGLEKENLINNQESTYFVYGINFQRKWIEVVTKTSSLDVSSEVGYDDSFALYLGHKSDWTW